MCESNKVAELREVIQTQQGLLADYIMELTEKDALIALVSDDLLDSVLKLKNKYKPRKV